jgi:hypothetical protein
VAVEKTAGDTRAIRKTQHHCCHACPKHTSTRGNTHTNTHTHIDTETRSIYQHQCCDTCPKHTSMSAASYYYNCIRVLTLATIPICVFILQELNAPEHECCEQPKNNLRARYVCVCACVCVCVCVCVRARACACGVCAYIASMYNPRSAR